MYITVNMVEHGNSVDICCKNIMIRVAYGIHRLVCI